MCDNLDNLLVEAIAKNLLTDNGQQVEQKVEAEDGVEEGELETEDGEIVSGDEKKKHKHKHKKSKSKDHSRSVSKKLVKKSKKISSKVVHKSSAKSDPKSSSNGKTKSGKHKKSKSIDKKNKTSETNNETPNENESEVMKLLLSEDVKTIGDIEFKRPEPVDKVVPKKKSKHKSGGKSSKSKTKSSDGNDSEVMKLLLSKKLKSYANIEFKDDNKSSEKDESKKSSKHESSKKDKHEKSDRHRDKRSKYSDDYYEKQKDSYYWTHSSSTHEDYFYGSYYEGSESLPTRNSSRYSRPLSPLYDEKWRRRSRSRSPLDYDRKNRSISPTERYYSRHRSPSPEEYRRDHGRRHRRSMSPSNRSYRSSSVSSVRSMSSVRSVDRVDKKRLLEIARANLVKMIEKGDVPKGIDVNKLKFIHLRELTTQKPVQQWTEFCRAISALETAVADDSDLEIDYDSDDDTKSVASSVDFMTIRHPFKLNERKDIQFRVRDFLQLPSRSAKEMAIELREQFPVSSGNQHRRKELEWFEIDPMGPPALPAPKPKTKKIETKLTEILNPPPNIPEETLAYKIKPMTLATTTAAATTTTTPSTSTSSDCSIPASTTDSTIPLITTSSTDSAPIPETTSVITTITTTEPQPVPPPTSTDTPMIGPTVGPTAVISAAPMPSTATETSQTETKANDSVFPQSSMPIDIGSVMAQRLNAMRKLQEDPHNVVALKQMYQANQMMTDWAESKMVPGQFIGSTGATILTPQQLNTGRDAWTRKDQLKTAAPITDGIGMLLLLKMGWTPGMGLGKNNEGVVDPIMLDIKNDKKGLVAEEEQVRNLPLQLVSAPTTGGNAKNAKFLNHSGKNPVSILHEVCAKKRWIPPEYQLINEVGPAHRKNFTFKVVVNGVEYQPSVSSGNKKQAKALAAGVCLQSFGLLPKDNN